ncbi:MAG: cupin domain-containing protein [Chloroflexota bacterium]
MTNDPLHERTHPVGETTGTPERPSQHLAGLVLSFDLNAEIAQLHREAAWLQGTHNAKTLIKEPDLRIVLIAMRDGARLPTHQASGNISIQALAGHLILQLPDRTVDLPGGHLVALEANLRHDVEARGESALLLTVSWQEAASASENG